MANLSREEEHRNRVHNIHQSAPNYRRFDPDCAECKRQRTLEMNPPETAHDRLRRETAELNKEYGTNYKYSEERGIYL